jgi:hypothetical protein
LKNLLAADLLRKTKKRKRSTELKIKVKLQSAPSNKKPLKHHS